jgi:hypothetical protein
MELHPLPGQLQPFDFARAETQAEMLAAAHNRRPKSLAEVLAEASARMDAEDTANDAYVLFVTGQPVRPVMRHPRKRLRGLLRGRG